MAIYTRTGDKGKTSLFNGQRILKSDLRAETYGTIDELSSAIGVVLAETQNPKPKDQNQAQLGQRSKPSSAWSKLKSELTLIQNDLLDIGASLANPTFNSPLSTLNLRVEDFERLIDKMVEKLPRLKNFILPGGGKIGAFLHLTRAICRRAERKIVALNNPSAGSGQVDSNIIIYMNRLSDLLFTMARFVNFEEKKKERIWPSTGK